LIRQGEGHTAYHRIHQERLEQRQAFEKLIYSLPTLLAEPTPKRQAKRNGHRSAEGDHHRLRGIPVLTRGVGSAIPDTNPLAALLKQERKNA
jgi:hypothetical protein